MSKYPKLTSAIPIGTRHFLGSYWDRIRRFVKTSITYPKHQPEQPDLGRQDFLKTAKLGKGSRNPWIKKSASILGWLFEGEHDYLWKLACRENIGDILEIGCWMGKSTCIFAGACKKVSPKTKVICLDTFNHGGTKEQQKWQMQMASDPKGTFYQLIDNACKFGFRDQIIPIASRSDIALKHINPQLRLIFVDGTHDYKSVITDIRSTIPYLLPGGIILFHDANKSIYPGIMKAIQKELEKHSDFRYFGVRGSLVAYIKSY